MLHQTLSSGHLQAPASANGIHLTHLSPPLLGLTQHGQSVAWSAPSVLMRQLSPGHALWCLWWWRWRLVAAYFFMQPLLHLYCTFSGPMRTLSQHAFPIRASEYTSAAQA